MTFHWIMLHALAGFVYWKDWIFYVRCYWNIATNVGHKNSAVHYESCHKKLILHQLSHLKCESVLDLLPLSWRVEETSGNTNMNCKKNIIENAFPRMFFHTADMDRQAFTIWRCIFNQERNSGKFSQQGNSAVFLPIIFKIVVVF